MNYEPKITIYPQCLPKEEMSLTCPESSGTCMVYLSISLFEPLYYVVSKLCFHYG